MRERIRRRLLVYAGILTWTLVLMIRTPLGAQSQPSLKVTPGFNVTRLEGVESAEPYIKWKATNADCVLIVGFNLKCQSPEGVLDIGGNFIFVAIGSGGSTAVATAASVTGRPGTGIGGIIYKLNSEFDEPTFFEHSYKATLQSSKTPSQIATAIIVLLQQQNYRANTVPRDERSQLVYTVNFNPNSDLTQSDQERRQKGQIIRQLGFIMLVRTESSTTRLLYVLPLIKRNFPRDNTVWEDDPESIDRGTEPARKVVAAITAAVK